MIRLTFIGLNSRNICLNPIDRLKEHQASEKEICYEADNEKNCLACGFLMNKFYPGVRKALCQGALFGTDPARFYGTGPLNKEQADVNIKNNNTTHYFYYLYP